MEATSNFNAQGEANPLSPAAVPRPPAVKRDDSFGANEAARPTRQTVQIKESGGGDDGDKSLSSTTLSRGARSPPSNDHTIEKPSGLGKKASVLAQRRRNDFFKHLVHDGSWETIERVRGVNCVWLGCASMALHFVCNKTIGMEDILRVNTMPLHYVSFPSVTLAELYDTINDYIQAAPLPEARCEIATFDSHLLEDNMYEIGHGERAPITSLAALRKELTASFSKDSKQIHIFNFDPFIVQEQEIAERLDDEDEEKEDAMQTSAKFQWAAKNMGQFALLLQFNPALHTVVLGTPHLQADGTFTIEEHTCSLQTLYQATCACDGYTRKPRGFVKVVVDDVQLNNANAKEVASVCALDVVDGRASRGLRSIALDVSISAHILGLGIFHNIVSSIVVKDGVAQNAQLRDACAAGLLGIPVSHICRVLDLPVTTIVGPSDKTSVATAFAWYNLYLERVGLVDAVKTYFVPVTRKGGAEDGAISIPVETFLSHVTAAVRSKSVMLVGFDLAQALNVVQENSDSSSSHNAPACNFAVVIGVEEKEGIVRLADVNVKKYRKTWHCPLVRLHSAVAEYGYMVAGPGQIEAFEKYDTVRQNLLRQNRYQLPPPSRCRRFEYPRKCYSITILADALEQLGFQKVNVESVMYNAGFHISFLLSEHIPLFDLQRIGTFFSATQLDGRVGFAVKCFDPERSTVEGFTEMIALAVRSSDTKRLLVNYDSPTIFKNAQVWNGSTSGGSLCIISEFDPATKLVTVQDCNHDRYYRVWRCPVDVLFAAASKIDKISTRARGVLWIDKQQTSSLDAYDMRQASVSHPFKPALSGGRSACALALSVLQQRPAGVEDLVYNNGVFNLSAFSAKESTVEAFATSIQAAKVNVSVIPTPTLQDFRQALGQAATRTMIVVLYDAVGVHGIDAPGFSGGIVSEVTKDVVKIIDGNPTTFGSSWTTSVETLLKSTVGVLRLSA